MLTRWFKSSVAPLLMAPLVLGGFNPAQARPDCEDWNTESFFKEASATDVALCLSKGADPNTQSKVLGFTPLHTAVFTENPAVVKALLDGGANVNARTKFGYGFTPEWTPLHMAVGNNETPAVVQVLLDAGADPNAANPVGWTPLHTAAQYSETPVVVQALLDGGADPNAANPVGFTPLHGAALYSKTPAVVQVLLDAGADLNAWTKDGATPIHLAAGSKTPAVIQVLLDAGADLNARTEAGQTPFDLIPDDSPLRDTDVYWQLNDASF